MNKKIVKRNRSRSFVAVALLNRGAADSESLRVRRDAYVDGSSRRSFLTHKFASHRGVYFVLQGG